MNDISKPLAKFSKQDLLRLVDPEARSERRLWQSYELALYAEPRLGEMIDPESLDSLTFARLQRTALTPEESLSTPDYDSFFTSFWILMEGHIVGTIALSSLSTLEQSPVTIWSFYIKPSARGQGLGSAVLDHILDTAPTVGCDGIRVGTHWTNQQALRFYWHRRFWVFGWKRQIDFIAKSTLPDYRCEIVDNTARFLLFPEGYFIGRVLFTARRKDPFLDLHIEPPEQAFKTEHGAIAHRAICTFSLFLALQGWPLIRSPKTWDKRFLHSDAGMPEGLAGKIEIFEALDRKYGFMVKTPRIPGIPYRDWAAIIAET